MAIAGANPSPSCNRRDQIKTMKTQLIITWALPWLLAAAPSWALDATLAADAHASTAAPKSSIDSAVTLIVGGCSMALVGFDLSTLPTGTAAAKLVKASPVLCVNRVGAPGAVEVQRVNDAWTGSGLTTGTLPPACGPGRRSGCDGGHWGRRPQWPGEHHLGHRDLIRLGPDLRLGPSLRADCRDEAAATGRTRHQSARMSLARSTGCQYCCSVAMPASRLDGRLDLGASATAAAS